MDVIFRSLTIRGVMIYAYEKEFCTALNEMAPLVKNVKEINKELINLLFLMFFRAI